MKRTCPHNRLTNPKLLEPLGTVWKCTACGAFIPETAITIAESK
jgi:hypothetical protein